jgi:hypothetical protein
VTHRWTRRLRATGFVIALAYAAVPAAAQAPEIEREVLEFIRTFQNASAKKDRVQLERLIAPAFTAIDRAGTVRNRAVWIEQLASGAMLTQKGDAEELSDDLAVFATTAAARTTVNRHPDVARQRDICTSTRTVYAKLEGEWRVISMQQTQLHDGPIVTASYDGVIGRYALDAGRAFVISRVGKTLFGTPPAGPARVPLFETPDGGLVGPGGEFVYTFQRDPGGRATSVTMTRYGKPLWSAKRVD